MRGRQNSMSEGPPRGSIWDIAIVFHSSLYRFTVLSYVCIQYISQKYALILQLSVFMIAGSYYGYGFLLNAGHVWRTWRDLFLRVHIWNSTRGKPCGDRMDLRAFMYQKGIAKVSLRISLWDWRDLGKKRNNFTIDPNINELIVVQDIARYRFW